MDAQSELIPDRAGMLESSKKPIFPRYPRIRKVLRSLILCIGIALIVLLTIPACLFILPIALVWTLTDKLLKILDD